MAAKRRSVQVEPLQAGKTDSADLAVGTPVQLIGTERTDRTVEKVAVVARKAERTIAAAAAGRY